ncbi:9182_t:CDS:2, partial [Dentiscutata erythropus]
LGVSGMQESLSFSVIQVFKLSYKTSVGTQEITHKPGFSVRLNNPKVTISGNSIVDSIVGAFNARIDLAKRSQEHQKEIETLDNHNNRIETTDNHVDEIEIVDDYEDVLENNESLEFDFDSVVKSLQQEPINKWKVHATAPIIVAIDRQIKYQVYFLFVFRNYPYSNFTEEEWQSITQTNKYTIHKPVMSSLVSTALHEAVINHLLGRDSYMHANKTPLSRVVA